MTTLDQLPALLTAHHGEPPGAPAYIDVVTTREWLGWKIDAEWPYEPSGRGVDVAFVKASR